MESICMFHLPKQCFCLIWLLIVLDWAPLPYILRPLRGSDRISTDGFDGGQC